MWFGPEKREKLVLRFAKKKQQARFIIPCSAGNPNPPLIGNLSAA
jgi:hypothetical protein